MGKLSLSVAVLAGAILGAFNPVTVEDREPVYMHKKAIVEAKTPTTTQEYIKFYAEQNKLDYNLAYWVAWCESGLENIPNSNGERYGIGIYQFTRSTWKDVTAQKSPDKPALCSGDIWNIEDNVRCAITLLAKGQLSRWEPYSGHCWLPKLK